MALPGPKDLLPDHLFYSSSRKRLSPPSLSVLAPVHPPAPGFAFPARTQTQHSLVSPASHEVYVLSPPASHPPKSGLKTRQADTERSAGADSTFAHARGVHFKIPHSEDQGDRSRYDEMQNEDRRELTLDENDCGKKHACSACGKCFNRPSSLRIHLNTHTGAKPYVCPIPGCSRSFNVSSNMRRHYRNHSNRAPPPLAIPIHTYAPPTQWPVTYPHVIDIQTKRMPYEQRVLLVEQPEGIPTSGAPVQQNNMKWTSSGPHAHTSNLTQASQESAHHAHPYQSSSSVSHFSRGPYPPSPPYQQSGHSYPYPPHQNIITYAHAGSRNAIARHPDMPQGHYAQFPSGHPAPIHFAQSVLLAVTPQHVSTVQPVRMDGDSHKPAVQYGLPPTPPYTNEAAQSPSSLSSARPEERHQFSPNATGLYVSALRGEPSNQNTCTRAQDGSEEKGIKGVALVENAEDQWDNNTQNTTRRSNLRITAIVHPSDDPQVQATLENSSEVGAGTHLTSGTSGIGRVDGTSSANGCTTKTCSSSRSGKSTGRTPGAAPPPPYPLYRHPLLFKDEGDDGMIEDGRAN